MHWLWHNPLANMYGPHFLLVYASVIFLTLGLCWWQRRRGDCSLALPPLLIPPQPNPYDIAYLRGGEQEVTRLELFTLVQRGYLHITPGHGRVPYTIHQTPVPPEPQQLTSSESQLFTYCVTPRTPREIFTLRKPAYNDAGLRAQHLLAPVGLRQTVTTCKLAGVGLILGLGGYKLTAALLKGYTNVLFLIIIGIAGILVLRKICQVPHASRRGQAYLRHMRSAFASLQTSARLDPTAADVPLTLAVALFGTALLAGTVYDAYAKMFAVSAAHGDTGSVAGTSCGSSSCGGGDGGSGCGGCGGGGGGE